MIVKYVSFPLVLWLGLGLALLCHCHLLLHCLLHCFLHCFLCLLGLLRLFGLLGHFFSGHILLEPWELVLNAEIFELLPSVFFMLQQLMHQECSFLLSLGLILAFDEQFLPVDELVGMRTGVSERIPLSGRKGVRSQDFSKQQVPVHGICDDGGNLWVLELQEGVSLGPSGFLGPSDLNGEDFSVLGEV